MDCISLNNVIPNVFDPSTVKSEIWLKNTEFTKGKKYLVAAASGTGKSSLCSFIYGDRMDFRGNIRMDGVNVRDIRQSGWERIRRKEISIVFQDLKLFPELTALENILIKNELTQYKSEEEIRRRLVMLGLEDRINTKAATLSWGQQQRVAFVRALCQPYDFIIMDEPLSHLDEGNANLISQILGEELRENGAGAIVTSLGLTLKLNYDKTLRL